MPGYQLSRMQDRYIEKIMQLTFASSCSHSYDTVYMVSGLWRESCST